MVRVGVVTHPDPDLRSPYFSSCLKGLSAVFERTSLIVNPSDRSVDGWVLLAPSVSQIDSAARGGNPRVIVNGSSEGVPSIDLDNVDAARRVAVHLTELGHRRIGLIAGKTDTANARDREEGFRRALSEVGIPWDPELVVNGRFERAGGKTAMAHLLKLASPPTAVFAANDHMALGARDALKEGNKRVPDDVALVGFDDIPEAEKTGLTSVRQPLEDMAKQAGLWLLDWIQSGHRPEKAHVHVRGKLMVRASSGIAPKK